MVGSKRKISQDSLSASGGVVSAFAARKRLLSASTSVTQVSKTIPKAIEQPKVSQKRTSRKSPNSLAPAQEEQDHDIDAVPEAGASTLRDDLSASMLVAQTFANPSPQDGPKPKSAPHSTFRPTKQNYQHKPNDRTVLRLSEGERVVILGSFGIRVTAGQVTIYGAILPAGDHIYWASAPHCHTLPVIRAPENSTIELLSAPHSLDLRHLERLSPLFGKLWNESPTLVPSRAKKSVTLETFQILFTLEDGPKRSPLQHLTSPAEWNKKLAEVTASKGTNPPVLFVCGPKSSGKSTFGKMLANRLITIRSGLQSQVWPSIAVLDIDPGQPEFAPPGIISLNQTSSPNFSPSFCRHPDLDPSYRQLRAHAIASVTPGQDPEHYVECVRDLFLCYQKSLPKSPLIVNTPGWIQGTGLDILSELIRAINPTEVIYMSEEGPEETVEALKVASRGIGFSMLPSQSSEITTRTSLDLRTMQTMAYFHLNSSTDEKPGWYPAPLTEMRPWRVRYSGKNLGLIGVLCYDSHIPHNLLADAVNGTVLALVRIEDKAAFGALLGTTGKESGLGHKMDIDYDNTPGTANCALLDEGLVAPTPEGIPMIPNLEGKTLNPSNSRALGLVLVRGIDVARRELQILTPLPDATILASPSNLVLVAGKFDIPTWAYTEDFYNRQFDGAAGGDEAQRRVEGAGEDADNDLSEDEQGVNPGEHRQFTDAPWVEELHGNQKRSVGSKVWRVRRDLGKS